MERDLEQRLARLDQREPVVSHDRPQGRSRNRGQLRLAARTGEGASERGRGERVRRAPGAAAGLALAVLGCVRPAPSLPPPEPPAPAIETLPHAAVGPCERVLRIEIRKRQRRLLAYCAGGAMVAFPVALGREPEGTKERAGDLRTPEGLYRVAGGRGPSRFHGFIPIDYPSIDDALRALAAGELTTRDYDRILEAHRRAELPPWDTPLGGEIGIHGEGERWRGSAGKLDWTYGCFALADGDLDFLSERLEPGVPVLILP
jgi:hypothetical protein